MAKIEKNTPLILLGESHHDYRSMLIQIAFLQRNMKDQDVLLIEGNNFNSAFSQGDILFKLFLAATGAYHFQNQAYIPGRKASYASKLEMMIYVNDLDIIDSGTSLFTKIEEAGLTRKMLYTGWDLEKCIGIRNIIEIEADMIKRNGSMLESINYVLQKNGDGRVFVIAGKDHLYPFLGRAVAKYQTLSEKQVYSILQSAARDVGQKNLSLIGNEIDDQVLYEYFIQYQTDHLQVNPENPLESASTRFSLSSLLIQSQAELYSFLSNQKHQIISVTEKN